MPAATVTASQPPIARRLLVDDSVSDLIVACEGHPDTGDQLTTDDRRVAAAPLRLAARQLACSLEHHPADATLPTTDDPALTEDGWVTAAIADVLHGIELAYALACCPCQRDSEIAAQLAETCARILAASQMRTPPDGHGAMRQALAEWLDSIVHAAHVFEQHLGETITPVAAMNYLDGVMAGNGFAWWLWALRRDLPAPLHAPASRLIERARRYGEDEPAAAERHQFITAELSSALDGQMRLELAA